MKLDREHVRRVFTEYTDQYDSSDIKVALKIEHTFKVAEIAARIARSLHLSEDDENLAWLLGMLHDVGRFEQLRRYHTFFDGKSVNHAALSADILFDKDGGTAEGQPKQMRIRDYIEDASEDAVIEKAIRLHNVFRLPEQMEERELMFTNILRDADKIDILRVNCEIPMNEIYDCPIEHLKIDRVTPEVLTDALSCKNVDRGHVKRPIDHLFTHISLTFGMVYPESFRITKEQGFLKQMMSFESGDPVTAEGLSELHDAMEQFMLGKAG
ncbi:HD domain-containing protein [Lachnospiraceae bacterium]|nr:HD domain-containing protein [Lachnospiraceae bacterium]